MGRDPGVARGLAWGDVRFVEFGKLPHGLCGTLGFEIPQGAIQGIAGSAGVYEIRHVSMGKACFDFFTCRLEGRNHAFNSFIIAWVGHAFAAAHECAVLKCDHNNFCGCFAAA